MTSYNVHGFDHANGFVRAWIKVGKREKLEPVVLTRTDAWRLLRNLSQALEATE